MSCKLLISGCIAAMCITLALTPGVYSQETNSRAFGRIISIDTTTVLNATVSLIHQPTQNKYNTVTSTEGSFRFFNLKPGGPYLLTIQSPGYEILQKDNLFIYLGEEHFTSEGEEITDFTLQRTSTVLKEVIVNAGPPKNRNGIESVFSSQRLQTIPNINRNYQDFVRMIPQARVTADGAMSLAGQNNRFNAFYIDGANNTDIRGLSVNGMNGGQTGSPPISIEAIEEVTILQAPYHVQYGTFTGGSINTITRSGTNDNRSSAWYYFRNEKMAGRAPQLLEKPGSPGEFYRPRLSDFNNQSFGVSNSGAIVKNKLFYFMLVERQSDERPQPFNMQDYRGTSNTQQLTALAALLKNTYQYDPGSFLQTTDNLTATRMNLKLDWNHSLENKFMLTYRLNKAERMTAPRPSSATALSFHHNGIIIPALTHSFSFEWKRFLKRNFTNRLLFTFTRQEDGRKRIGEAFPTVTILDGSGTISFGSESATGINHFKAWDHNLLNVLTYTRNKHLYTAGIDVNYSYIRQGAVPAFWGAYQFRSLSDFMNGAAPTRLQRSFYRNGNSAPPFSTLRASLFINDEYKVQPHLTVSMGVRADVNAIPSNPPADPFFNDTARAIIAGYYQLNGAVSGKTMRSFLSISPRIGFQFQDPAHRIKINGGAGIFSGRIVNAWIFDLFNSQTGNIDIVPQQFVADPYNQPTPASLNIDPNNLKGALTLVSKRFKYPAVFRSSVAIEKSIAGNWKFTVEGMLTKNIHETAFQHVNLLPPIGVSSTPGSRTIYSLSSAPSKIPLRSNGVNPYAQIILFSNNDDNKGYAWSVTGIIQKQTGKTGFVSSYTYGQSRVLFEITGPQTPTFSQWRNMETVNGRNAAARSVSDNDLGHRVTAWLTHKIKFCKGKTFTTISLFYNGQSGAPFSYVYTNSMINDNGRRNENFDLIYIPTTNDLAAMDFVPVTSPVPYSAQQQKDALNEFIENDKYLRKHRGEFAARNAARLPFTHTVDLRLQQDLLIKFGKRPVRLSITYDVFNLANLFNKNWGRIYFLSNDSYPLIRFENFSNATTLTPQYQFIPFEGKPWSVQPSTIPGSSARWISQLGIKINVN